MREGGERPPPWLGLPRFTPGLVRGLSGAGRERKRKSRSKIKSKMGVGGRDYSRTVPPSSTPSRNNCYTATLTLKVGEFAFLTATRTATVAVQSATFYSQGSGGSESLMRRYDSDPRLQLPNRPLVHDASNSSLKRT